MQLAFVFIPVPLQSVCPEVYFLLFEYIAMKVRGIVWRPTMVFIQLVTEELF
jgi:hypothetical protein